MQAKRVEVGQKLRRSLCFSEHEVSQFARLAGDENPIHHDLKAAQASGFEGLVACGPQLSSLMMGLTASYFSSPVDDHKQRSTLGLDFRFRFRRAVLAKEQIELSWEVLSVRHAPSLGGDLIFLRESVTKASGASALKAAGKLLVH